MLLKKKNYSSQTRRRQWHPTPVLLPGKSHGPRSLEGANLMLISMVYFGVHPKLLRNMCFAKKHKKSLKKMQATNAKAMSARAEVAKALVKPKEVKPKVPIGGSCKLSRLAYVAHPKFKKSACAHITKGLGLCWPKSQAKAQTKTKAPAAKSLQSCLTLCNPIDGSAPGSPIPGILQARTLE
ncbi:hypothetical protein JEQ12_018654 [Ovis aries]|uniref:60S ribosomal protein L29 n=1 Tax=Ovis aries TaxID=9940 RepID=A0A836ABG1_SHEEP|nr:hypothetical protein JEQ12_018654 [Ovis aries]